MRPFAAVLVMTVAAITPFGYGADAVNFEVLEPINILSSAAYRLPAGTRVATIELGDGSTVEFALLDGTAPRTTEYFNEMAEKGFYDDTTWNRVVPGFVVQGGSIRTINGDGDTDVPEPESNGERCTRGAVFFARKVIPEETEGYRYTDTIGNQFCILLEDAPYLDDDFTVFGRVISGMETLDGLYEGEPIVSIRVVHVPMTGR
jgi:cyclophilin family peptidyl-prolyl cis-trans isomerase